MKINKGVAFQKTAQKLDERGYFIKFWLFLGVALHLLVELLSRKSILGLGKYVFLSPLTFLYNTTIILATLSIALIFRKRLFALVCISLMWIAIGVTDFADLSNDAVYCPGSAPDPVCTSNIRKISGTGRHRSHHRGRSDRVCGAGPVLYRFGTRTE